jgi:hypothetical protein
MNTRVRYALGALVILALAAALLVFLPALRTAPYWNDIKSVGLYDHH